MLRWLHLPRDCMSAHITEQPFTQIRKEMKIQKLREDRAFLPEVVN